MISDGYWNTVFVLNCATKCSLRSCGRVLMHNQMSNTVVICCANLFYSNTKQNLCGTYLHTHIRPAAMLHIISKLRLQNCSYNAQKTILSAFNIKRMQEVLLKTLVQAGVTTIITTDTKNRLYVNTYFMMRSAVKIGLTYRDVII